MARRVGLDAWRGANALGFELFVSGFRLFGGELPGFDKHSGRRVDYLGFGPGAHTMWCGAGPEALLRIDHYEAASRERAHDLLVVLLAGFESPLAGRRAHRDLGDVAFADDAGGVALFARGNLVVFVRRAGREPVSAFDAAAELDRMLVVRPSGAGSAASWTATAPIVTGDSAALVDNPGENDWLRFVSSTGGIHRDDQGSIVYRSETDVPPQVTVYREIGRRR
jgi:hypothetical protein